MKKLFAIIVFALAVSSVISSAQVVNDIQLGAGFSRTDQDGMHGVSASVSYGMDIFVLPRLSVMPTIGVRAESESLPRSGWDEDVDFNDFGFIDLSVAARLHLGYGKSGVTLGLAPCFSFTVDPDEYKRVNTVDGNHRKPEGDKLCSYDLSLMPSVCFEPCRHFGFGVKGNIGVRDSWKKYPEYDNDNSRPINSLQAFLSFRF